MPAEDTLSEQDVRTVHAFLSEQSTWARGIPLPTLRRALAHSLCFTVRADGELIAFARVISDRATFANLVDVFVLPAHRGQGHARTLLARVLAHPDLAGLRRFTLATADAHGLYARIGFSPLAEPQRFMERYDPGVYRVARPADER